ncbi:MAG: YDG domain-containing protein, partial [Leptothrix sp. (in: b-proteobacteria)]
MSSHASMNRIFRLVFNDVTGVWMAVAETARGRGKRSVRLAPALAALLATLGLSPLAQAGAPQAPPAATQLPTGGKVTAGTAQINPVGVGGAVLNVDQSSQRAVIDWTSFNVGAAAQVNFNQPDASSATLNRVLDSNASQIAGRITAPGQVFLSNPNGVIFGKTATVDVGGLTATTHSISDADFMAGLATFTRSGATGAVVNEGELHAALGGYIALLAPEVRNQGVVVARLGSVVMASGESITLQLSGAHGLAGISVRPSTLKSLIDNRGAVLAPGGLVVLSALALDQLQGGVIRNSGQIEATGLAEKGGRIVLEASQELTLQGGRIDASNTLGGGGRVTLSAERVGLFGASVIDASGANGGGQVLVGGGYQGKDAIISNAQQVVVGAQARIDASATRSGDGGQVVVWSDGQTNFAGAIQVRGGAVAGDGGQVEVSGKRHLDFTGQVDAGAARGQGGGLLLDPRNLTIDASGAALLTAVDQFVDTPSADSVVAPATITAVTNTGTTVTLQANNDITINSSIASNNTNSAVNGGKGGNLVFQAGRSITVNASITSDSGNVSFTTNDAGAGVDRVAATPAVFQNNSLIDAGSGSVSITMGTKDQSGSISTGQITGGSLSIAHNGATAGAVSGQIDLGETNLSGALTITAGSARNVVNSAGNVVARGTTTINVGSGDVTLDRSTNDFNIVQLTAGNVTLADANAMRFGTSAVSGTLTASTVGPMASTGAVTVGGAASFTATDGGFGYADPSINLSNPANHFAGGVTLNVTGIGDTATGGAATLRDSGALSITSATVATDLNLTTGGALSQTGAITVPRQTVLTSGAANNITLAHANNDFGNLQIVSGKDVTINDKTGVVFGNYQTNVFAPSHVSGNLDLTAAGDISQSQYGQYNFAPITVDGTTRFTTSHASAPVNLYLGPDDPFDGRFPGSANNFTGAVTLARSNTNTGFTNVQLRNISAAASVLNGLTDVGALNNVFLRYDNAPAVTLPGMTLSGSLKVFAPGVANTAGVPTNKISQTGAIVVAQDTMVQAGASGDVELGNAGNNFNRLNLINARNATVADSNGVVLYGNGYASTITGNLNLTTGGAVTDASTYDPAFSLHVGGTATLNSGSADITLDSGFNTWNIVTIPAARNVTLIPNYSVVLGDVTTSGTLFIQAANYASLTQLPGTSVNTGSNTTTLISFDIALTNPNNVLGPLAVANSNYVNIRENDAITQASAWGVNTVSLTTSNDQAITLDKANAFGNIAVTQINNGATSAGAVLVRETNEGGGVTQALPWSTHGATTIDSGVFSVNLTNPNNVFGPLQVLGGTGGGQSVNIYAKPGASGDAITDVGAAGAWNTGGGVVRLIAYDATGTTAGAGNINLSNPGNVLGDLYIKANNVTVTEADHITDGVQTAWNGFGDTGWVTTGTTNLIVANPSGRSIVLDNVTNRLGALGLGTTGTAGSLGSVLITDNSDLTQASPWNLGTAPVTLDARNHAIDLSSSGNVLGNVGIGTANGIPTSVALTENDAITQSGAWVLPGVPVTLVAENGKDITLNNPTNIFGNLAITGGTVSIVENDPITQAAGAAGKWTTTGTTTLNATTSAITLNNPANVLGPLAIAGNPSAIAITENDDITQSSAWVQGSTPITLNAGTHDIVLSQAANQLGDLTLAAQNVTVTENHADGISDGGAWIVPGRTTLNAGAANPVVLNANPASDFGSVAIVAASNADIADVNGIVFGASNVAGTLTVTAGGAMTQTGAITAPSLHLIGAGNATLTDPTNHVGNLAAGFSGGDLAFTNAGDLAVAIIGGTSGVTIGAHNVALTSVAGTVTGLTNVNASSSSLAVTTGTALTLPLMSIAGAQTYTASTLSGSGVTLTADITSTAAGAISFNSPVTLAADVSVQSLNSPIAFSSTLAGAGNQLTVNAGSSTAAFHGAVSALGTTSDAGAALQLTATGGASFDSTLNANNGLTVTGPVQFNDSVSLADGNTGSVFAGRVTLNKAGGMSLSGYDGMTFNNGVQLQSGDATINSNNSALIFQSAGSITGPHGLTLDAGTQTLSGLDRLGHDLTSLSVTALTPTIPAGGVSIDGPQSYSASAGSSVMLGGNVTSTAPGAITFNSPVTVAASSTVSSSDSAVVFAATVDGNSNLTVASGSAAKTFGGAVGSITPQGSGSGAALVLQGSGATHFADTVATRSGMSAAGPVSFDHDVSLGNGDTGSTFNGLVSSGGSSGNHISGFDGLAFNAGLALTGGPVTVASNGSTLSLGGAVSGSQALTLDALGGSVANPVGTITGLEQIGAASTLTRLDLVGQTLSLPASGLAVAGPMSVTAAGGITLNGPVGSAASGGQIDFASPVHLASGPVAVSTHNAAINFHASVDGAQSLSVDAGSATTTFTAAVGAGSALASLDTNAGGSTAINGGSVRTSGAQTYRGATTLGADTSLSGVDVSFTGRLDGAQALSVNDSGTTRFAGVVGGSTPLTSITTDAPGQVALDSSAISTSGAQTYHEHVALGADTRLTGTGLSFGAGIDGAHALTADAGTGALRFDGSVGATTPLNSLSASGNTVAVGDASTSGAQSYSAVAGATLGGHLTTVNSDVSIAAPTTLGADVSISTGAGAGNIVFQGATSTVDGAHSLTLAAGSGNVAFGGVVGSNVPLSAVTVSGYDLALPVVTTAGDANQSFTALHDITLTQSRILNAPASFRADADGDGSGAFILLDGVGLTTANQALAITAADLDLRGNSTISTGSGQISVTASNHRNIALGGADAAGQLTISGAELARITSSGGLELDTTGSGWIHVAGISAAQSQNLTGTLALQAQGSGDIAFVTAPSTFNGVSANASAGLVNVGADLSTSNDAISFVSPTAVSGNASVNSGGGNISFGSTLAVDHDLTLGTGNGALSFGGAVSSNKTLTLNLDGGSVSGLTQLQPSLTGLTVNSSSSITLPALAINGPQVYNTGAITLTGDLGGVGLAFNNTVDLVPASGNALTLNAGTGTLAFASPAALHANNVTLAGDEISIAAAISGSGHLLVQPATPSRNVTLNGSGAPVAGSLNLSSAELAHLPIGTLAGLEVGNAAGSGSLDVAGVLNVPGTPLTLNGGGGISQTGGAITSGPLTLYAAGNAIALANGANAFGAVAINGAPSAVNLVNTQDITQQGSAGWALGSAPLTLDAGSHDIVLTNAGNSFGSVTLSARNATLVEAAATDLGAARIAANLTVQSSGVVTQSGALTVGGNLDVATSVSAGDVRLDNSGASASLIGNTQVGGNYVLTATGQPVAQATGEVVQVRGDFTVGGASLVLGNAGNLIGGTITTPGANTVEVRQSGVITLGNRSESGSLNVISERTSRSFSSTQVSGDAIVLNNPANNIGGHIAVSASPPTIVSGADVQTGIVQATGTSISVAGTASFTAEASSAGSLGIDLSNAGNNFGTLLVNANTVNVRNSATGTTTLGGAIATTGLTLTTAGGVAQTGAVVTPALAIDASGSVSLNHPLNNVDTLSVTSAGQPVSYVDADGFNVAGLNAGGANVSLSAGGHGNLTQSGALQNVAALSANAGGAVTLNHAGNTITTLATSSAGTGLQVSDSDAGLTVTGTVRTLGGDLLVRSSNGDLTLSSGGRLQADAGGVVAVAEGGGNFINDSGASALVVGSGQRWLVYSSTPDLVAGAHIVKGGLASNFRHYASTYGSYAPGAVSESGNGYVYAAATGPLTVRAAINGAATQVYGDSPTGSLGYVISGGLMDSEDTTANVISGGTAVYDGALANTLNVGSYSIKYTGGLTSSYTLQADSVGAGYSVTPAVLTYTADAASRTYGAANPVLSGTISGFKLGQTAAVLTGSAVWTTPAGATSNVGSQAIFGGGYSSGNYNFVQASGNTQALTITKAALTVSATDAIKTYDGVAYSGGNGVSYSGFVNGEGAAVLGGTLAYGGSAQGARNAGSYVITPSGLSSGNYAISYADGSLTVSRANLVLSTSNTSKTYDGTLAASGTAVASAGTQLFGSDTLSGGSFAYADANAGSNKRVSTSGVTVNDGNGGGNYNVSYADNTSSSISRANLTIGSTDVSKTYDGTLAASGTARVVSGTLFSNASNGNTQDSLSGGTFAYTDANAGAGNKIVTTSGVSVNDGNGGGNYNVSYAANTSSTINKAVLVYTANVADKTYDGTTGATLTGASLAGLVSGENLGVSASSASFIDKNAGAGKTVDIAGITLSDGVNGLASNYSVAASATASATITPKQLSVTANVADKVYDGSMAATLQGLTLSGFVGAETVSGVHSGSVQFDSRNVGAGKTVTVGGVGLIDGSNGGLASNYTVAASASGQASVTPATLRVAGLVALDKVYDGTLTTTLNTQGAVLTGTIGADQVQLGSISGSFLDKNAGTNKPVVGTSAQLGGADALNYTLEQPAGMSASITPRSLTVAATGVNKVYDASTAATVQLGDNRIVGDQLSLGATASFLDKNVGVGKFIEVGGITVTGPDAGNYSANTRTSAFADISKATLNVGATGVNRVYDASTAASVVL